MQRIYKLRFIAIAPVIIAAILNTGYQYLVALELNGGIGKGDWRDRFIENLGVDYTSPGIYGTVVSGLVHILPVFVMAIPKRESVRSATHC